MYLNLRNSDIFKNGFDALLKKDVRRKISVTLIIATTLYVLFFGGSFSAFVLSDIVSKNCAEAVMKAISFYISEEKYKSAYGSCHKDRLISSKVYTVYSSCYKVRLISSKMNAAKCKLIFFSPSPYRCFFLPL